MNRRMTEAEQRFVYHGWTEAELTPVWNYIRKELSLGLPISLEGIPLRLTEDDEPSDLLSWPRKLYGIVGRYAQEG